MERDSLSFTLQQGHNPLSFTKIGSNSPNTRRCIVISYGDCNFFLKKDNRI